MTRVERMLCAIAEYEMAENEHDQKKAKKELLAVMKDVRNNQIDAETLVRDIMAEIGAPESLVGYPYTVYAILKCIEDEVYINNITYRLYPEVAAHFDTTASRVERAIRHLIEVIFQRTDMEVIYKYFRNTVNPEKGKLTNGELIARIANIVRLQLRR